VVSKLVHGRADDFKIKTPTAVCGVRVVYTNGFGISDYTLTIIVDGTRTTYSGTLEGASDSYPFTKQ